MPRKAAEDYRMLAENSPDLIARFDARLRHLYVNPAAARAGKLTAGEYVGSTIAESGVPEPAATSWNQRIRQVLKTGRMMELEDSFPTPEGLRYFHTRITPELNADGSVRSVLTVAHDITERKKAEDELNLFFDLVPDMVCIASTNGFFKRINGAWETALGYSPDELLGTPFVDLVHPDDRVATMEEVDKQLAGGTTANFVNRYRHKDGSYRWLEWRATPAVANSLLFAAARDITDRRRSEKLMHRFSQEIIAAREEERQQVSAVLHHDVGSLAVGISAHLDAMDEELRAGKPREALKWMRRTRKLFDRSVVRLKGLAVQLRPPELDVLGLRAALRQHFSQATKHRGALIHFTENLGRRRVSGDTATILFRVAQEALTNAITHGCAKRVDVELRALKREITLTVHDNGKGFDPSEHLARETFTMGLRVMQEMAISAGGTFAVESGRKKGTTVRVRLPLATAATGGA